MPVTCIVVNCGSRADRDHAVSFFRIPSLKNSVHYPHLNDLSKKRRDMWSAAIKRENLTESILRNQRVCSIHFITGKPSALNDENHPDWVPSQHMGHESQAHLKRKSDVDRKLRADKRRKLIHEKFFLSELTKLFQKARLDGSVTMAFKRYNGHNRPKPREGKPALPETAEHMCLIRAKFRSKKIATVVHQKDVNKFQVAYSSLLKGNIDGLKKVKKPKNKTKVES